MPYQAIAFDCYGTLLRITDQRRPYSRLALMAGGRLDPSPMIAPLSLAEVVTGNANPIPVTETELTDLQSDLSTEIASIIAIPGALEVLSRLRRSGYRLGIVSNLAAPYAAPARDLLGDLVDTQVFSFEVGAVKPSPIIYGEFCNRLSVQPKDALMIGDSIRCDYYGAIRAGLTARHLTAGVVLENLLHDLL